MIDWARVKTLQQEIEKEEFPEVLQIFFEESDSVIDTLANDPSEDYYEKALHLLRGSALNLGFSQFAALCQEAETRAQQGLADSVVIAAVITTYHASRTAFMDGLAQQLGTTIGK